MTSYLRSWLYSGTSKLQSTESIPPVPTIERFSPPPDDEDGDGDGDETETETERHDDRPPACPALNSAQRAPSNNLPTILSDSELMPPPPLPSLAWRQPGPSLSKGNMLVAPPRTERPPPKPSKKRGKVALAPGYGPLDWAALKSSGSDLRVSAFSILSTRSFTANFRALTP